MKKEYIEIINTRKERELANSVTPNNFRERMLDVGFTNEQALVGFISYLRSQK